MTEILPAILTQDWREIESKVPQVAGLVGCVQIDFCDGKFVSTKTFPFQPKDKPILEQLEREELALPLWQEVEYEFDLMVTNASFRFEDWVRLGASRLVFHLNAEDNLLQHLESLDPFWKSQVSIGIAITATTDISVIAQYLPHISYVQCMGIEHIGLQGQPFDNRVLDQIQALREMYPDLDIQVDGSVNHDTASDLVRRGATRLVIGSALWKSVYLEDEIEWYQNL